MALARALLLVVLVLTQVALGGAGSQSVLCIEPGGRVALEQVGALCCEVPDSADLEHETIPGESVSNADCCACIDIPLPGTLDRSLIRSVAVVKPGVSSFDAVAPTFPPTLVGTLAVVDSTPVDPGGGRASAPPRSFAVLRC